VNLCRRAKARGNLITDTDWAALAIKSGSEWDHDGSWLWPLPGPPAGASAEWTL